MLLGAIVGFTNLGEVNDHLSAFERSFEDESESQEPLAKSMLVLMVRGLFTKLQFPYVQFPCTKLHGYELYDLFLGSSGAVGEVWVQCAGVYM